MKLDPLGRRTGYVYDLASQVLRSTDPLDRTTSYEYDDLGRLVKITQSDPDGAGARRGRCLRLTQRATC
jgi:YD repeat-containing protein